MKTEDLADLESFIPSSISWIEVEGWNDLYGIKT